MSDTGATIPINATPPTAEPQDATALGLWTTLAWGTAAAVALDIVPIVQSLANAWAGTSVQMPWPVYVLPTGHIVAAAILTIAVLATGITPRTYFAIRPLRHAEVWTAVGLGLVIFIGIAVLVFVCTLITAALGGAPARTANDVGSMDLLVLVFIIAQLVLVAPIVEELLFRGFMYRGIAASWLGVLGAILAPSIIFGLVHWPGYGWERAMATGYAGAVFGVIRWRSRGTSLGMATHAVTNVPPAILQTVMLFTSA